MENYYERYQMADELLKLIAGRPKKQFFIKDFSKSYIESQIIELVEFNKLAVVVNDGKYKVIKLTPEGEGHLLNGGYSAMLGLETELDVQISFKHHLDENANLLSIFGILNAIILFAGQAPVQSSKGFDFYKDGMQFVSVSMYILSILVLIEIIQNTLLAGVKSWKFHTFYLCLCTTTLGIGGIFLNQYWSLLVVLLFALSMYAVIAGVFLSLMWFVRKLPLNTLKRVQKNYKQISTIIMLISLLLTVLIFKVLKYFFEMYF